MTEKAVDRSLLPKGRGPFRRQWYSLCSKHSAARVNCENCQAGYWVNDWGYAIDHLIYSHFYRLWLWMNNRPHSHSKERLRQWFPHLR